ncbi:MAG: hypothetical protein VCD00_00550 [Candidatus Hydrogenedentota bacterium]
MIKKFSCICIVLIMGSTAWGQPDQEQPPAHELADTMLLAQLSESSNTPESAVQSALQHSPEIRKAELAVELAQADLRLVRARITRDVIALHAKVTSLRKQKKHVQLLAKNGVAEPFDVEQVLMSLAEMEGELKYLTGSRDSVDRKSVLDNLLVGVVAEKPVAVKRPAIAKETHIWEILQQPCSLIFDNIRWPDLMKIVSENYDLNINVDATLTEVVVPGINIKGESMYNSFLALTDLFLTKQNEEICFVIRDYGIFLTTRDHAARIPGPSIPTNIPFYE